MQVLSPYMTEEAVTEPGSGQQEVYMQGDKS